MKLISLLPFMENEEIKELALQILSGEVTGVKLVLLFPFMSSEDLDEVVDKLIEKKEAKQLMTALPFISREKVNELYDLCKNGELEGCRESMFLPFLGKSKIKQMVKIIIKEAKEKAKNKESDVDIEVEVEIDEEDFEIEED